ncbi:exodeoxyribonuclease I [Buchnera aphidicola (Mindarus keteleerifoliae)]|uniref:exodeoxyribonuclease I n=1 Tax=Buchnera aphidicola TaxID=9 RepID=UPI0031B6C30B
MNIIRKDPTSFLFYDYETFGTNPALDKPCQFAYIRTDFSLNNLYESEIFYCYPPMDYFPDPKSLLITGITPKETYLKGMNEFIFSKKIFDIFSQPNSCIVGFNNIAFDDEITRNIFYRNLIDPYEWSWKNGNSRWDIINVIRACFALRPEGINWPKNSTGLNSFKLSDLTYVNGIQHEHAHQALSDVMATFKLMQLIKNKKKRLFSFLFKNRFKENLKRIVNVKESRPIIYISSFFGTKNNNLGIIVPIFWDSNNSNSFIAVNIINDINKLVDFVKKKDIKANDLKYLFQNGLQIINVNKCPILIPINVLSLKDISRLKINLDICFKNLKILKNNDYVKSKIKFFFSKLRFSSFRDVDLQIYDSFFNKNDKNLIKSYRKNFFNVSNVSLNNFNDSRIKEIIFRCKARNFPHILNADEKNKWKLHCFQFFKEKKTKLYIEKINSLLELEKNNQKNVYILKNLLKHVFNLLKFFKFM